MIRALNLRIVKLRRARPRPRTVQLNIEDLKRIIQLRAGCPSDEVDYQADQRAAEASAAQRKSS